MKKNRTTKRALLLSALSLLLCFSMLVGTTYAWFTDSVTSAGNIIKSGKLDVAMYWAKGVEDPADATWEDASQGAIFNYDNWEPGYAEVRHIKIANEGTLALKYQLQVVPNGTVSELSDVIDVYYADPAVQVGDRADLASAEKLGTLTEVLGAISTTASGSLEAGKDVTVTLALKMQETAGNEYQEKSIGTSFSVKLTAIQKDFESDSFDSTYDEGLDPEATYVSSPQQLKDAMLVRGANIVLNDDIVVDSTTPAQYGAYMFLANGREVTIDLNGHSIVADESTSTNVLYLFTTANGGTLNIVGDGVLEAKNASTGICWAMNKNDQINIYGGVYNVNGTNWGTAQAILYTNSGNIDVYGGKFLRAGHWCSNADDSQGSRVSIVFHEGATFIEDDIQQGDSARIKLEDGCYKKKVTIDGETWYQVTKGVSAGSEADLLAALNQENANIFLTEDVTLTQAVSLDKEVNIDLNGKTLSTNGMELQNGGVIENGTVKSAGNTYLTPHLKLSGGSFEMKNVTVDVEHTLNANTYWTEATGMEVANGTATLTDCDIKIHNGEPAKWVFCYGVGMNNATVTMNGGSITATCVDGTAANGPTNPYAISSMGACSITLKGVAVTATYYATTVNGHLTVNTTDRSVTDANIVDNDGGSHTLSYID